MLANKIAFFDSGVGGLTTLHVAMQQLPNEDFIYFGDCLNAPYGVKTTEEIRNLVFDAVEFLQKHNCKAIVLACNTATSAAVNQLREKYPNLPIVGMEPAVKLAGKIHDSGRILITATDSTLRGQKLNELIHDLNMDDLVDVLSLQELVLFAEKFEFDSPALFDYLKLKLEPFNWDEYNSIVLGCTHFNYFKNQLRKFIPETVHILDGNQGTVNRLKSLIKEGEGSRQIEFYLSKKADPDYFSPFLKYLDNQ